MSSLRKLRPASALAVAAVMLAASPAGAQSPGSPGLGDPYFPLAGNGGYEVDRYDLGLKVRPRVNRIAAVATITATATQSLTAFNLDLSGLKVSGVTVDGVPAAFSHRGPELSVTPSAPIASGASFTAVVAYRGRPHPVGGVGWHRMRDGTLSRANPAEP